MINQGLCKIDWMGIWNSSDYAYGLLLTGNMNAPKNLDPVKPSTHHPCTYKDRGDPHLPLWRSSIHTSPFSWSLLAELWGALATSKNYVKMIGGDKILNVFCSRWRGGEITFATSLEDTLSLVGGVHRLSLKFAPCFLTAIQWEVTVRQLPYCSRWVWMGSSS